MELPDYITISIPFSVNDERAKLIWWTSWYSKLCAHRLLNDVKSNLELSNYSQASFLQYSRKRCYDILPNRRYIDGIATLIHSSLKSARKLGANIKELELDSWLLFQSEAEKVRYGNLNIRLTTSNKAEILAFDKEKNPQKIVIDTVHIPKGYKKLVDVMLEKSERKEIGYPARVVIKEYNAYSDRLYLYCQLQVMVPYALYKEVMKRYDKPLSNLIAGIDVNVDRLNLAIIDSKGNLRDKKTFWFDDIISRGYKKKRAWSKINEEIHRLLNYAYNNGVSTIVLENPKVVGYLRYYWINNGERKGKSYNFKVSMFRNSLIERIIYKAPLYSMDVAYVSPKGTTHSKGHDEIMRRFGLDRHTASAYLIALKSLQLT